MDEWRALSGAGGQLKRTQVLGTIDAPIAGASETIVRLTFARDSLLMGFVWTDAGLIATAPRIEPLIEPILFGVTGAHEFATFDWRTGQITTLRCIQGTTTADVGLELQRGPGVLRFRRRAR